MTTSTWNTDATGEWNVSADWSGGVPDAGTDAVIAQGNPEVDATTGAIAAHSLTLSAPGTLTFDGGAGTIGTALTNSGRLSLSNDSSLTADTLTNNDVVYVGLHSSIATGRLTNSGTLDLYRSGSLNVIGTLTNSHMVEVDGGSLAIAGSLANNGTIYVISDSDSGDGGSLAIAGTLANSGTIRGFQSMLDIGGAITGIGTIDVDVATTMEFHGAVASTQMLALGDNNARTPDFTKIVVDDAAHFHGTVDDFIWHDKINLAHQVVTWLSLSGSTLTATLKGGGTSTFAVRGTFTGIMAQSDGHGGSDLTAIYHSTVPAGAVTAFNASPSHSFNTGTAGADLLVGTAGHDALSGLGGNDTLNGGDGSDTLNGGTGHDIMAGGDGNDTYVVDNFHDRVIESAFQGTDQNLLLTGSRATRGVGNSLDNHIHGNAGANHLSGLGGNDLLDGGLGNDVMTGGTGNDTFVFDSKLAATNIDHIVAFVPGQDHIDLQNAVFTALTRTSHFHHAFVANTTGKAATANQHIIYDEKNGALFYDADGSGTHAAAIHFATFTNHAHLVLTAADFLVS